MARSAEEKALDELIELVGDNPELAAYTDLELRRHALQYDEDWLTWLLTVAPSVIKAPFAPHHREFWDWAWQIEPGHHSGEAFLAVWGRGAAKSTSAELAALALLVKRKRRLCLYVSSTQHKANDHIGSIQAIAESRTFGELYPVESQRLVGKYAQSKGWKRNRLRFGNGSTVDAYGLDAAMRGVKIDDLRPDLIILDDIDDHEDTSETVEKKLETISREILPSGAAGNTCVILINNLVHDGGVTARVLDSRSPIISNRRVSGPIPVVVGLQTSDGVWPDGRHRDLVIGGEPTWEGQDLDVVQAQIDLWGLTAFLAEAQHDTTARKGDMFLRDKWGFVDVADVRATLRVRAWDIAATEGDGDWTVGSLWSRGATGRPTIEDVVRRQTADPDGLIKATAQLDGRNVAVWVPQDPGAVGKRWTAILANQLAGWAVYSDPVSGSKETRARAYSSLQKAGGIDLVRAPWNGQWVAEHETFPRKGAGIHDDDIDSGSAGFNHLASIGIGRGGLSFD